MSPTDRRRTEAAARLDVFFRETRPCSFIRLGDGEVQWYRQMEEHLSPSRYDFTDRVDIEIANGVAGLEPRHFERFKRALVRCTFLDRCDYLPPVAEFIAEGRLPRPVTAAANSSPEVSNIIFEWTQFHLRHWLGSHRCLIAGAEASLLRELWNDDDYRACAAPVVPSDCPAPHFHQVREDGRRYSENLDLIKQDLADLIRRERIEVLFLSLATGAKILCVELAEELGVLAIDFGSMTRALCYAGSSGYQANRDMHSPFFFHVPFPVHAAALRRAFPTLPPAALSGKLHAQIALEVHPHKPSAFNTSLGVEGGTLDRSPANLRRFRSALRHYRRSCWPRLRGDPDARAVEEKFRRWLLKHDLDWKSPLFKILLKAKALARRVGLVDAPPRAS